MGTKLNPNSDDRYDRYEFESDIQINFMLDNNLTKWKRYLQNPYVKTMPFITWATQA